MQAGHPHDGEKAHGLKRDRLAACVGAGDHDHIVVFADGEGRRDDLFRVNERMPALQDADLVLLIELRPDRALLQRELAFGKDEVELRHVLGVRLELGEVLSGLRGEVFQDAGDLFFLLDREDAQLVVQLDNGLRLDEERGSARGLVVHDAGDLRLVLRPHRQAVAIVADRDQALLQIGGVAGVHHLRELAVDLFAGLQDAAADALEFRRSVVRDVVFGENDAPDLGGEALHGIQALEVIGERVVLRGILLKDAVLPRAAGVLEERGKLQELRRGDLRADGERLEGIVKITVAAERNGALPEKVGRRGLGLGLRLLYVIEDVHRREGEAELFARRRRGVLGEAFRDPVEFGDA